MKLWIQVMILPDVLLFLFPHTIVSAERGFNCHANYRRSLQDWLPGGGTIKSVRK
jgi:hypothetical protein